MRATISEQVIKLIKEAISVMDDFMRNRIDLETYSEKLNSLDVSSILERHREDFKVCPNLVYCLDALMMLSSLQHELDFQVAEYGANVASEDIRMLKDTLAKISNEEDS